MFSDLVIQFLNLAGVAALVSAIVNVVKTFGLLKDGAAPQLSVILSTLAFGGMVYMQVFQPEVAVWLMDEKAAKFAEAIMYALGFAVQLGLPAYFHKFFSEGKIPLIGYSYSVKEYEEFKKAIND